MFKHQINKNRGLKISAKHGFTMIEMIVSISLITIITALFVANYRQSNKRTDLIMAAQSLVADLHLAQNNTLGLVKYNMAEPLVPSGGWGVNFDLTKNSYTIFADLDGPGENGNLEFDPDVEGEVRYGARTTVFPSGVLISSLKTNNGETNQKVNVTFLPPDPKTNIYRVDTSATSTVLEIELKELRDNTTKTVRVNFLGLVEVID